MNTPLVYTTLLLLAINSSHVYGIPINRKHVKTKEIPKVDDILPSHILSRIKLPKKTVKDVLQKFVVGNIDLKNLYKLGDDVFEYFDEKAKLSEDASMKTKGANDSRHPLKRPKEHKHREDKPLHIKGKRKETENGGMQTRAKKLKKKHKNARKTTKRKKSTTKTVRTTTTSGTPNTTPLPPTTKIPPPYHNVPIHTEGIRTATVTERKKTLPADFNKHVSPLESSLITSLNNPVEPTAHSHSESYNKKGQTTPKMVKSVPGSVNKVNGYTSQSEQSATSSSVPSYLSHSSTASSTWTNSLSSSAQFTSTSTRSTSSIHITSSLTSLSLFTSLVTSSMPKWKTSKLLSISVSVPSMPTSSSSSLHLLNTSMSEPFTSSISLSPISMSSSFPSATSNHLITSSSKMLMSSAKFHVSSSTSSSSLSTKSSSTTTELLHVTTSSQIPTEKSSSSSSSSSLIP